ncbi:family 16 glycosyl hydrolase [Coprinopsis sp. MPI-PUGE-AT-0042]|nr:family 16 glycosyl hydrolase [Coprinopsis sp. MPI-PUGE-AT-0042]
MLFTWKHVCILATVWLQAPYLVQGAEYTLSKEYSGPTFFDGWKFFDGPDILNSGDVEFIGADDAGDPQSSLAYVDPATNRAIIKVDNTSIVPWSEKRKSVRITTEEVYDFGSVFVADIYHFPYGCSVWSSFWTWNEAAGGSWPDGGEIDIFEAINMAPRSQMGLHTRAGCAQPAEVDQLSTEVRTTNCEGDIGCIIANTDPASYGPPLNQAGGGIHVAEFLETGISIWFFSRDKIPSSITPDTNTIDTSKLGKPMGYWPSGPSCDLKQFFKPQNIVMKITLCGVFAGAQINQTGCQGRCYDDFVLTTEPSRYSEAYFDVASVRVFSVDGAKPSNANSTPRSSGTPTGGANNNTETQDPGAAVSLRLQSFLVAMNMVIVAVALGAF